MSKQGLEDYLAQRRQQGLAPKKFASVAGKTIESVESSIDDDGHPHVYIIFTDGEILDITWETTPKIAAEWSRRVNDGMELEPISDRKIFR